MGVSYESHGRSMRVTWGNTRVTWGDPGVNVRLTWRQHRGTMWVVWELHGRSTDATWRSPESNSEVTCG